MIGLGIAGAISDRLVKALTEKKGGLPKPEYRLPTMIVGGFVIPIGLFMYGWTAEAKAHVSFTPTRHSQSSWSSALGWETTLSMLQFEMFYCVLTLLQWILPIIGTAFLGGGIMIAFVR